VIGVHVLRIDFLRQLFANSVGDLTLLGKLYILCNHTRRVVTSRAAISMPSFRASVQLIHSYDNAAVAPCAAQHYPKSILPCSPEIAVARKGQESVCISATGRELINGENRIINRQVISILGICLATAPDYYSTSIAIVIAQRVCPDGDDDEKARRVLCMEVTQCGWVT